MFAVALYSSLSVNGHIKPAKQRTIIHQYGEWYTRRWWGGLLHLVQRGGAYAGCGPAQSPPRCSKCNSQCTNFISKTENWCCLPIGSV